MGADAEQESNESSINLSRLAAPPFPIQLIQQQQCHRLPIELSSVLPHHQVLIQLSPFFSPSESLLMSCSINVSLTSSLQSVFVIAAADGASVQTTHRAAQEAGSLHLSPAGNRGPSRRVSPLPGPDRVRRLSRLGSPWLGRPASPLSSPELVRRPSRAGGHQLSHHCSAIIPVDEQTAHCSTCWSTHRAAQTFSVVSANQTAQNSSVVPAEQAAICPAIQARPTAQPSSQSTSRQPTARPAGPPTGQPRPFPSSQPTRQPRTHPSSQPSR